MKNIVLSAAGALLLLSAAPRLGFSMSSSTPTTQQETDPATKTFTGTVLKEGDNFILSDSANKLSFVLDDAEKVRPYEGKKVKVTGTVDTANDMIHVETI